MSDAPVREGVTARYAVTHEMTPEGLLITEDQVVTVEAGEETTVPLGDIVPADPLEQPPPAPVVVDVPHVSGAGMVGEALNCTMGNWEGEPTSYVYQWKADGVTNLGTGPDYVVADTDVGHSITCVVTASNAGGSAEAPPSNAVAVTAASEAARSIPRQPPEEPASRFPLPRPEAPAPAPAPKTETEA